MRLTGRLGLTPFAPYHWLMYAESMWFDIEHCREELDWQPRYSNDEMLAESYDWFVANRGAIRPGNLGVTASPRPSSRLLSLCEALVHATMSRRMTTGRLGIVVMALLAYVPALLSSPGRMPADTKLYLYLNPRRLVSDSIWTFDARQFAGWVPHQMIAYAWPSGPWYVVAEALGLPDWVAHRLWIATIMLAAGAGVAWAARRLGLSIEAAIAAGLLYQLSPYLVPYVSRTSSMLLPWAALGWIVGLTIGAATRTRWRDAALCALVIGTVGAVNTTALLLIAPAPVLWLVRRRRRAHCVRCARAVAAAARIGGLTLATSAWWIVMQIIQGRQGADLLAYSESLEDVSLTATSVEAWRSLGYWLMYIRDPYAPTTTAGADYMTDRSTIVSGSSSSPSPSSAWQSVSFPARRFAIALTFTGLVLAVGVHPFSDPSPIARLFRGDGQAGLSLALRSSTRALPLLVFGLALGTAALVDALGRVVVWRRAMLAGRRGRDRLGQPPSPRQPRSRRPSSGARRTAPGGVGRRRRSARRHAVWFPRAAPARSRVRGVHVGIHRRPAAPGPDGPAAGDTGSAPPRFAGGDGSVVCPRRPLPDRIGRARRRRPDRPPVRRRHDLAARRCRLRPLPHAAARVDGRPVRRRRRRSQRTAGLRRAFSQRSPGADGRRAVDRRAGRRITSHPGRARLRHGSTTDRPGQRHGRRALGERRRRRRRGGRRLARRGRSDPLQRVPDRRTNWWQRSRRPMSSWSPTAIVGGPTTGAVPRTSPATRSR